MSTREFVCRRCGNLVSSKQYELEKFCPKCGTRLSPRRQPKHWIFQFNPATYGWFDWIKEGRETEQWLTAQYAKEIREGDKVAIWSSGKESGVYAMGEILENPSIRPLSQEQAIYFKEEKDVDKFRWKKSVLVRYLKKIIDKPLLKENCSKDPILATLEILKRSEGTNFPLTEEQWDRIWKLAAS
jgi:predicted RNA-binding protein with PUA-like domain/DNA-directed RNA polymerase subunit RPC12/RpoP